MENLVAHRIKNARILKCLSQQNVADEIGVSKQMVSKYEKGEALPSSSKFIKLSRLFGLKIDYFFSSFQIELGEINFRKKSTFSLKKQNSLKEQIKISLENYLWIEDVLSIDYTFKNIIEGIKIQSIEDVENVVLQLRNEWEIGIDPIHNIIQLLEDKEIKVIELFDVDEKFDGMATYVNNKFPVIVVNGNFPVERKRFTLLHELGHLLLNLPECNPKEEENFCNKFAAEFLFPKQIVIKEFGGKRDHITLTELISTQKKYGISIPAIVYRLVDSGILSKQRHTNFYKKIRFNSSLNREINLTRFETPENSNRYERLVYRALAQENISFSKASSLLNKNIEAVKESSLI
ncbi:helix-turn-helix domain-containing protein [Salinimicrobium oceani]|uniref:ImmA/IrrE family metallo-endopeptidase n=1 Tax=Salinimicrobium oceani TaxID=2722702 RepID=A0ABX1CVA1_9FLAO|nr:XRE family transcriptional regulator [Salinimicrobium oceani]NJW52220.1 ImmA/IrrE family metallo-endopeptidase [Salinimicrobium oceani]